jgi:hypothetical protein
MTDARTDAETSKPAAPSGTIPAFVILPSNFLVGVGAATGEDAAGSAAEKPPLHASELDTAEWKDVLYVTCSKYLYLDR